VRNHSSAFQIPILDAALRFRLGSPSNHKPDRRRAFLLWNKEKLQLFQYLALALEERSSHEGERAKTASRWIPNYSAAHAAAALDARVTPRFW
jgi:hypothetical protein